MWGLKTKELQKYGTDITVLAHMGKLDPVIGREKELELLIQSLLKRRNSRVCLVGDAGVGKTAIVEALALKIAGNSIPKNLIGKKIFSIDMGRIVDGAVNREEIEKRVNDVLKEVRDSESEVILFIDDLHNFIRNDGIASVLKVALARDDFKCIGVTTEEEYTKDTEKDEALMHMFETLQVCEPSKEECLKMVEGIIVKYFRHHGVQYTEKALILAVDLSKHYMRELRLPKNAIDLIDKAGARVHMLGEKCVAEKDIEHVVSTCTGVRLEKSRLLLIADILQRSIIGQDEAVRFVGRALHRARHGIRDEKTEPVASFLFTGPTGVGKTEMARVLAKEYFGSEGALVMLDTHEFMEHDALSMVIGYLAKEVRRRPHSLVLLDGIEKAHKKVLNVLLQILENGRLCDGKGKLVDFSNTIVIVTSNSRDALEKEVVDKLDQVVVFKPLEKEHIGKIFEIMIQQFQAKNKIQISVSERLKESLISNGFDKSKGAWALNRSFATYVESLLALEILTGRVAQGDTVKLDLNQNREVESQILPRFQSK